MKKLLVVAGMLMAMSGTAAAQGGGMGGGDFSSYMPSTSLFFPNRLKGTALGIQAGIGNFGVSLAQFLTPWIIGFAAFGAAERGVLVGTQMVAKGHDFPDVALGVVLDADGKVLFSSRPDGKALFAKKEVKVTLGGCGG